MTTRAPNTLPRPIAEVVETAVGANHRDDPVLATTGGPAGNARLTAWTGVVLLVALAAEGVTLLSLHRLIAVHLFVGALLVPLALLKTATTVWRMLRYYVGDRDYRQAGPPPLLLRLLGPLVVVTTLGVLGTGLALVPLGQHSFDTIVAVAGARLDAVTLHKATFVVWFAATALHTIGRAVPAARIVAAGTTHPRVPGGALRLALLTTLTAVGVVAGLVVVSAGGMWLHGFDGGDG